MTTRLPVATAEARTTVSTAPATDTELTARFEPLTVAVNCAAAGPARSASLNVRVMLALALVPAPLTRTGTCRSTAPGREPQLYRVRRMTSDGNVDLLALGLLHRRRKLLSFDALLVRRLVGSLLCVERRLLAVGLCRGSVG